MGAAHRYRSSLAPGATHGPTRGDLELAGLTEQAPEPAGLRITREWPLSTAVDSSRCPYLSSWLIRKHDLLESCLRVRSVSGVPHGHAACYMNLLHPPDVTGDILLIIRFID